MTSLWAEAICWLLRSPSQTCHAKPKNSNQRARTLPASFPLVGCLPQAAWPERLLSGSQDAVALQQIKERGALPMIDRGDIRRQCSLQQLSGLHCRALVMVPGTGWQPDCKIQRSGRNGQRDWCMSRVTDYLRSWLSASSSTCHGLLIITVITPLPTKPSATKMPENWSWRTRQLLTCRCVSVMLLRSMQNTRRVSWC